MTTDIEKTFFETFGIEPKCETRAEHRKHECYGMVDCDECASAIYPQITDRILLELICILNENTTLDETYYQGASTVKELKKLVLKDLIKTKDNFDTIPQVQALFKGE